MENYRKCANIHINPSFGDSMKSVIHINPKVSGNMAIHVNPEVVNKLVSTGFQQQKPFQSFKIEQPLDKRNYSVQKSVYVNPKLMHKLKNILSEESSNVEIHQQQKLSQPKYFPISEKKNETQKLTAQHLISQKCLPSRFVAISKNKLIRICPETKKRIKTQTSMTNVNTDNCGKSTTLGSVKKINTLKKVNIPPKVLSKTRVLTNQLKIDSRNNKYKIDRTLVQTLKNKSEISRRKPLETKSNLINIDGIFYKSSKSCLVRSTNSSRLSEKQGCTGNSSTMTNLNSSRSKKIRKHSLVNIKIATANSTLKSNTGKIGSPAGQKINYKHLMSNRVKQKSLQILRHKMCKNNQPCLLYQRFGYCAKYIDGTCPKVHDKKQIALCKNFLQGKCLLDNCPLSHEVGPEKMPTCKYFLDGCCTRDSCQYLHVKVSDNTSICVQFLRGYCAKGDKCKERHIHSCPEFHKTGKCPKGKNCPYPHKSSLFAQQTAFNGNKKIISIVKPNAGGLNSAMIDISSHDDNSKRYYDESNCNDDKSIEQKKRSLNRKIKLSKSLHSASSNSLQSSIVETITEEMKSQSVDNEARPKRPLIGPLPSYIPIN